MTPGGVELPQRLALDTRPQQKPTEAFCESIESMDF